MHTTPLHDALEKQAREIADENERQLRRLAQALRAAGFGLPPDQQACFSCGTSDNRYAECSGCRAARKAEGRSDTDRESKCE